MNSTKGEGDVNNWIHGYTHSNIKLYSKYLHLLRKLSIFLFFLKAGKSKS